MEGRRQSSKPALVIDMDREILAEVLGVFSSEYPRQLAELRGAIDRKEPAAVLRCVHKIKSSVGTTG